jgi:hypothetical protein
MTPDPQRKFGGRRIGNLWCVSDANCKTNTTIYVNICSLLSSRCTFGVLQGLPRRSQGAIVFPHRDCALMEKENGLPPDHFDLTFSNNYLKIDLRTGELLCIEYSSRVYLCMSESRGIADTVASGQGLWETRRACNPLHVPIAKDSERWQISEAFLEELDRRR